jgi:hypothetical protein
MQKKPGFKPGAQRAKDLGEKNVELKCSVKTSFASPCFSA